MSKLKVLLTRAFIETDISDFEEEFDLVAGSPNRFMDRSELLERLPDTDAVIIRHQDHPDREFIDAAPKLKIISNYGAGYESVDVDYATARGVWVTNTPEVLTDTTAELAMTLILCACRRVSESEAYLRGGQWKSYDPNLFHGADPRGKLLGIIGMGRIGQATARLAQAFGMRIQYHNRHQVPAEIEQELGAVYVSFSQLLRTSDVISVHAPLTPETEYLIDEAEFAAMKEGVYFVNTGRGKVVRESALAAALASGHVRGAGIDVYENEPEVHPDLLQQPNCTLVPHIGSATRETRKRMADLTVENVRQVLRGQRPVTPVNEVC